MKRLALLMLLCLPIFPAAQARAQGCTACRDNTAGSGPQLQQGLRRAIPVLGIPAAALFVTILVVAARTPPRDQQRK